MEWVRVRRVSWDSISSRSWHRYKLRSERGTAASLYLEIRSHYNSETREKDEKGGGTHKWFPRRQIVQIALDGRGNRFDPRCRSDVVDLITLFGTHCSPV